MGGRIAPHQIMGYFTQKPLSRSDFHLSHIDHSTFKLLTTGYLLFSFLGGTQSGNGKREKGKFGSASVMLESSTPMVGMRNPFESLE